MVSFRSSRRLYRERWGRCRQFLTGDGRDTAVVSSSFGHESYRENFERLEADRVVDMEVNGDEVVTEDGASRWPLRRRSIEHAGGRRRRWSSPDRWIPPVGIIPFQHPGWTPMGW
jgi:hypothetical protein